MNLFRLAFLFFIISPVALNAADTNLILTLDGITYSNVTFGSITPTTVTMFHSGGVTKMPLEKLPAECQKQLGYDAQKAADWHKGNALRKKLEQQRAFEKSLTQKPFLEPLMSGDAGIFGELRAIQIL